MTYAPAQFSGWRFGCPPSPLFRAGGMPAEDLVFGFAMTTQGMMWWQWWGRRLHEDPHNHALREERGTQVRH